MKTLIKLFTLKPYGDDLADGMAQIWLLMARLNILAVAFVDGTAWFYLGFTTSQGTGAYITGAIVGLIAFVLVGSLDASFIMHDPSERKPEDEDDDPPPAGAPATARAWYWLRHKVHRDHLAIGVRIVLVVLSFTVTAPFLTQLFFARDITAEIVRNNERTTSTKRDEIIREYDRQIDESTALLATRQNDLSAEIAGAGQSGRYGKGPTAKAIDAEIHQLQDDIAKARARKTENVAAFDTASKQPELMAKLYGVDFVREGPDTRARVVSELEKSPAFRATRRTIKAFLLFLFLCLLALKFFQPASVKVYFTAKLQAAWSRLKAGIFDKQIEEAERAGKGGMPPLYFADWYLNQQHVRELTDQMKQQAALQIERVKIEDETIRIVQESLATRTTRMNEDLAHATRESETIEQRLASQRTDLKVLNAKIAEQQQELDDFRHDRHEDLSLRDKQFLISGRDKTVRQLADNRAKASDLNASITRLTEQLQRNRAYEQRISASIDAAGAEAAALAKLIARSRRQKLGDILSSD